MSKSEETIARALSLEWKVVEFISNRFAQTTTVLLVLPYDLIQGENRVKQLGREGFFFKDVVGLIKTNKSCTVSLLDADDPILTEAVFKEFAEHGSADRKDRLKRKAKFTRSVVNDGPEQGLQVRRRVSVNEGLCILCMDQRALFCVLPCNHVCYCEECVPAVSGGENGHECPICRGDIFRTMRIYFP